jgi:hypothetical protein
LSSGDGTEGELDSKFQWMKLLPREPKCLPSKSSLFLN